uniref:Uncharacterized protein n=1 Tax=Caudovirales sp. ctLhN17 TaxID=2825764 RepID=A0A8S5NVU2_9CAUD|nr:MAG TPA: hypothetical protein [Caudovirales sp. ctLhN17]
MININCSSPLALIAKVCIPFFWSGEGLFRFCKIDPDTRNNHVIHHSATSQNSASSNIS